MASPYSVALLGGLRVLRDGAPCPAPRTRKAAALLGWLALHPDRPHTRETLADRFWPEMPADAARNNLRTALGIVRDALGPDFPLHADRRHVTLAGCATDVARVEALLTGPPDAAAWDEILALYVGPLLPECYDDWALARQRALEEALVVAATAFLAACAGDERRRWATRLRAALPHRPEWDDIPPSAPAHAPLPVWLDRFVGRRDEIARLDALLAEGPRLITLVGPGGVGKTRLASTFAKAQRRVVRFVALAAVDAPRLVPDALRRGLGLPAPHPGSDPLDGAVAALNALEAPLLLLDNLEHLDGIDALVARLLTDAPGLTCLATSRAPLGVRGERVVALEPLPDDDARRLFRERAGSVRGDAAGTDSDAAVAELCARLDRLPLALELAAAHVGVRTPAELLADLDRRLDLAQRRPDAERHRSLRAAIHWSWDRLPERLQRLFAATSVFHDGWDRDALAALAPETDLLADLEALRAASLVQARPVAGAMRFSLLETLRAFAAEQLDDARRAELELRHARHFADLAERLRRDSDRDGHLRIDAGRQLDRERANLRAAFEACRRHDAPRTGLTLAIGLWPHAYRRGETAEALAWTEAFVETHPSDTDEDRRAIARGCVALSALAQAVGDLARQEAAAARSRWLRDAFPDDDLTPWSFDQEGLAANLRGDLARAEALHQAEREAFAAQNSPLGLGAAHHKLGLVAWARGDRDRAIARFEEALTYLRPHGDPWWIALVLYALASQSYAAQRWDEGDRYLEESAALYRDAGSPRGEAEVLDLLAEARMERGDSAGLQALLTEGRARFTQLGWRWGLARLEMTAACDALTTGDYAAMRESVRRAHALSVALDRASAAGACRCLEAILTLRTDGDTQRATALLDGAEPDLTRGGGRYDQIVLRLIRAEVAARRGEAETARAWLVQADAMAGGHPLSPFLAGYRAQVEAAVQFATPAASCPN